jgi:hypothetical protein
MKKKILILGSNPETFPLVKKANEKGLITYVIGREKKNKTKDIADFPIIGDASNEKFVSRIIKSNKINAVLPGTVDVLMNNYVNVCKKNNLPCYANQTAISHFSSKIKFSKITKKFGFKQIADYTNHLKKESNLPEKFFPVMVKPVDSGGGVGAKICYSNKEVLQAISKAKKISKSKKFICQDYFLEDDIQLYYTILNGKSYLSCVVDRTTNKNQNKKSPVCIGTNYNSKYLNLVLEKYDEKFKKMIKFLKISNGVLSVQCFVKNNEIYPYDPGFRLQGEGQHLVLNKINKFDHLDMLINFSLGKFFFRGNFNKINDPFLKNKYVSSVWILLKQGVIKTVVNLDKVKNNRFCIDILQRLQINDRIKKSFIGTEKQVFARIYLASNKKKDLIKSINFIHKNLKILDVNKKDMILDKYVRK